MEAELSQGERGPVEEGVLDFVPSSVIESLMLPPELYSAKLKHLRVHEGQCVEQLL